MYGLTASGSGPQLPPPCHHSYLVRLRDRPGVSASLMISACSCWWRFPLPVAGLAFSDLPTYRTSLRVSSSGGLSALAQKSPRTHIPRFLLRPHGLRRRTACSVNLLRRRVDGDRAEQQILEIETEIRQRRNRRHTHLIDRPVGLQVERHIRVGIQGAILPARHEGAVLPGRAHV